MKTYLPVLAAVLCAGSLFADSSGEELRLLREISERVSRFNRKLSETQKHLDVLEKELKFQSRPSIGTTSREMLEKLEKIRLPEHPTEEQIAAYIKAIQKATEGVRSYSSLDMQVDMYRKIGPGHLKTFLPLVNGNHIFHMTQALPSLVEKKDKEFILDSIEKYPFLLQIVYNNGWTSEATPRIWKAMEKATSHFHQFQPFLSSRAFTPEQRKKLVEIFCSNFYAASLGSTIENFPDTDLSAVAEKAWNTHRKTFSDPSNAQKYRYLWRYYAFFAAKYAGNTDALLVLAEQAVKEKHFFALPGCNLDLLLFLNQLTGQGVDPQKVLEWVKTNKEKLVFDKRKQCFVLPPTH